MGLLSFGVFMEEPKYHSESNQSFVEAVESLISIFKREFGDSWQSVFMSSVAIHIGRAEA